MSITVCSLQLRNVPWKENCFVRHGSIEKTKKTITCWVTSNVDRPTLVLFFLPSRPFPSFFPILPNSFAPEAPNFGIESFWIVEEENHLGEDLLFNSLLLYRYFSHNFLFPTQPSPAARKTTSAAQPNARPLANPSFWNFLRPAFFVFQIRGLTNG